MAQTPQPNCASDPAVAGTPSAAPSMWTFSGTLESTGTGIFCQTLTNGLDLTLGSGLAMGTKGTPLTGHGVSVVADGDGNNDVAVKGAAVIHSSQSGILMRRDGTGLLGLELTGGRIVVAGTATGSGIEARHTGAADEDSKGVRIVSGADIDLSRHTSTSKYGIWVNTNGAPSANGRSTATVPVTVRVTGGTIDVGTSAGGSDEGGALRMDQHAKGDIDITVEPEAALGREGSVAANAGIDVSIHPTAESDIAITHRGRIYGGHGIYVRNLSTSEKKGNVAITTDPGSVTVAKGKDKYGILAGIDKAAGRGVLTVTHNGSIDAAERSGIYVYSYAKGDVSVTTGRDSATVSRGTGENETGVRADARGSPGKVTVVHRGVITAKGAGIRAANRMKASGTWTISVTTERGSVVTAERQGILVWHQGTGRSGVTVRGTVRGDSARTGESGTEYAGVHIQVKEDDTRAGGGGTVTVGPRARISSGSGTAIKVDARAGGWTVILEKDGDGLASHLDGRILNADSTAAVFKTRAGESGAETVLSAGDRVDMRGKTNGVYERVHRTELEAITGGHQFREQSQTRLYHDRARVYEALPSVLLDLNRRAPGSVRASPAGGGQRVWGRVDAGEGKRRAAASATGQGYRGVALSWDMRRRGVEAGFALPLDDRLTLGASVRRLRGGATVKEGGRIEVSGLGVGLSAAYDDGNGLYFDVRISQTRFGDIDLFPDTPGRARLDLSGTGLAAGVEFGKDMTLEGMDLTPRGGLTWSSVKVGAFDDVPGIEGSGVVSPGGAQSLIGGLGVLAEFGGAEESSGRGFVSLDLEHEFSSGREVVASGTKLSSKAEAVWARLGAGGSLELDSSGKARLSGEGHYAAAGSGNSGYGGSVSLTFRF